VREMKKWIRFLWEACFRVGIMQGDKWGGMWGEPFGRLVVKRSNNKFGGITGIA